MNKESIEEMRIAAVDPSSWRFRVGYPADYNIRNFDAMYVSGTSISEEGAGMIALPNVGDPCLVLIKPGGYKYILGYFRYPNTVTKGNGGSLGQSGIDPSCISWTTRVGGFFRATLSGTWHWGVNSWAKLYLGAYNQELRSWFRNVYIRMKGGKLYWEQDKDGNSKYTSSFTKGFEYDINDDSQLDAYKAPVAPNIETPVPAYQDKVIKKINHTGKAFVIDEVRTSDKSYKKQHLVPEGADLDIELKDTGRTVTLKVLDDNYLSITCASVVPEGPPEVFCTLTITEDNITVAHTGELLLGGAGEEQQLVTKSFVTEIFNTHQHVGNNGAPTGFPLNVGSIVDPTSRSSSAHFTKDVKGE